MRFNLYLPECLWTASTSKMYRLVLYRPISTIVKAEFQTWPIILNRETERNFNKFKFWVQYT